jgi:hypothetical protein
MKSGFKDEKNKCKNVKFEGNEKKVVSILVFSTCC